MSAGRPAARPAPPARGGPPGLPAPRAPTPPPPPRPRRDIYANADEDTRRAMMKSYVESNGTALSTNWKEVGAGKVETKPPQGMEARKFGEA